MSWKETSSKRVWEKSRLTVGKRGMSVSSAEEDPEQWNPNTDYTPTESKRSQSNQPIQSLVGTLFLWRL